jgi:protein-S-isoprenylcysteine O-methyltransferase Ste14
MTSLVLLLDVTFLVAAFGIRTLVQLRRTGDAGWRLGPAHRPAERVARLLLVGAGLALGASVVAALRSPPPPAACSVLGAALSVSAIVTVLVAQLHMGDSWRIGVDPAERTLIVTTGLYRLVRNPIYTGMVAFAAGQVLLVPSGWTLVAVVAMAAGVEIQVRIVEEQHLAAVHRDAYCGWAAQVGRFVPFVGRV